MGNPTLALGGKKLHIRVEVQATYVNNILDNNFTIAEKHLYYFYNTIKDAKEYILKYKDNTEKLLNDDITQSIKDKFITAMDDDFNTTIAISELYTIFKYINFHKASTFIIRNSS